MLPSVIALLSALLNAVSENPQLLHWVLDLYAFFFANYERHSVEVSFFFPSFLPPPPNNITRHLVYSFLVSLPPSTRIRVSPLELLRLHVCSSHSSPPRPPPSFLTCTSLKRFFMIALHLFTSSFSNHSVTYSHRSVLSKRVLRIPFRYLLARRCLQAPDFSSAQASCLLLTCSNTLPCPPLHRSNSWWRAYCA